MSEQSADRAAAAGDAQRARVILDRVVVDQPDNPDLWIKLSAMCAATGDTSAALIAIERGLALRPLDFSVLLHRALLLERLSDPRFGEAFGHALAQVPADDDVPPEMRSALEHARRGWSDHQQALERTLSNAVPDDLPPDERARIDRLITNVSRRTRTFHQEPSNFHFPGLPEIEFHDPELFGGLAALEAETSVIRAEFDALVDAEVAEMVPYIQYPDHIPLRQWAELNRSKQWTAIHLLQNGQAVDVNARHCPATLAAIGAMDQPSVTGASPNVMFSLLAPNTRIPPHTGVSNTRLVCHLPLIVPPGCGFRCGATTIQWQVGKAFVFDDTIEHEAWNDSDQLRVVLIIDLWPPALSAHARRAVASVIEANGADVMGQS